MFNSHGSLPEGTTPMNSWKSMIHPPTPSMGRRLRSPRLYRGQVAQPCQALDAAVRHAAQATVGSHVWAMFFECQGSKKWPLDPPLDSEHRWVISWLSFPKPVLAATAANSLWKEMLLDTWKRDFWFQKTNVTKLNQHLRSSTCII